MSFVKSDEFFSLEELNSLAEIMHLAEERVINTGESIQALSLQHLYEACEYTVYRMQSATGETTTRKALSDCSRFKMFFSKLSISHVRG